MNPSLIDSGTIADELATDPLAGQAAGADTKRRSSGL